MRNGFATALIFACSVACGAKAGSPKLEGHWKGLRADVADPTTASSALQFALQTEVTAKGNQITIKTPFNTSTSTYAVDSEDKQSIVIHTDKEPAETFTFLSADQMQWRMDEKRTIVFQRVKD